MFAQGWEVFAQSGDFGLNQEGYAAAAYLCRVSRSVVIAQRGTADEGGVYTDVFLFFVEVPYHIHLAAEFTACVEAKLSEAGLREGTRITYTGHSLGAVIAACCACREGRYAVTFDSPGEAPLLEKLLPDRNLASLRQHVLCFVSKPNLANTLHDHVGTLVRLVTHVDDDKDVVHVRRITEFLSSTKNVMAQYVILPTLKMNLPRGMDENLGLKINYLLRHRDRHMMRLFRKTLWDRAGLQCEHIARWPLGTLQCFLFDSCDAHLSRNADAQSPSARASREALATVYETRTYFPKRLTRCECGAEIFALVETLVAMKEDALVKCLVRAQLKEPGWALASALPHLVAAVRQIRLEHASPPKAAAAAKAKSRAEDTSGEDSSSCLVLEQLEGVDKYELLSGLQRWEAQLHQVFSRQTSAAKL